MKRPRLRNQLLLPAITAAIFAFVYYIILKSAPSAPPDDAPQKVQDAFAPYWWALRLTLVAMWLALSFIIVRVISEFVFFLFHKRKGYEAPSLVRDIFALVAYILTIALVLKTVFDKMSLGALLPTSALLGVILGLALQDTLGNLFAGISLHADKPFQVGDVITVGKWTGVVESITWRAVKIRTFSNHIVLVSNSSIAKESIEVCPRGNPNARNVFFTALYSDSPVKVINVVREAVREVDNVLRYMTPVVRIRDLGAHGVDYEVKYWLNDYARYNDTDALIRQRIWYAFHRSALTFAYPTQTVYLERHAVNTNGQARDITARLSAVDIFSPLSVEELSMLADGATGHVYAPGETIIREGEQGASMFVVHRGSVDIRIENNGQARTVNTLSEGTFFGEMALFTGEPRTANVVAAEETEVFEIGHTAMRDLFESNPDLVQSLCRTIAERRAALTARVETVQEIEATSAGLLSSIKRFFHLD